MCREPSCSARPQDRSGVTLADIVRAHGDEVGKISSAQARALSAIVACRTAALGGHVSECDSCGHQRVFYNSCRNRHCPQCQALAQARWVECRQSDLLNTEYFHVVFTIPSELHDLFLYNQTIAYGLLFSTAAESLNELARDPRHIGATLGEMSVLHTWTQTIGYHPHVHCIVPGGGPSLDQTRWVRARRGFLLPVRPLSILFRGKLLSALEKALGDGRMSPARGHEPCRALKRAARKRWNVYSKPSFVGPEHVIRYLGRYTHRIAISNGRLVGLDEGEVTFRYEDRTDDGRSRRMTLSASVFLQRFLMHVLPTGFVRIRTFGGLANATRKKWLALSRRLLNESGLSTASVTTTRAKPETWQQLLFRLTGIDVTRCPKCRSGRMVVVKDIEPDPNARWYRAREAPP